MFFDEYINHLIVNLKMEGEIKQHKDFCNYLIHFDFKFRHKYLSTHDILSVGEEYILNPKKIMDDIISFIKEIKFQFDYYFNELWC